MSERWDEMDDMDLKQIEAEMAGGLRDLREAATVYADRKWAQGERLAFAAPVRRGGWFALAAAGVAAAVLTVGGVQVVHRHDAGVARSVTGASTGTGAQRVDASAVSDEALLEQVQSDLSTGVPAAMEPLRTSESQSAKATAKRSE